MPGRTRTRAINYKEVDSVSESSESSSEDEEDHELKARLEASGAPLVKRKRTKKKRKSSDKSRKRRRQKGPRSRATEPAEPENAEEDDGPGSGDDGPGDGAGEGASDEAEAFQAMNLLGTLPFELICEIFSYLDLGDLVHLARTSPALNAMLLAPSARSIWSRSRRSAGYVLFPGMSEIRFAVTMEGSLCQYCGARGRLETKWMARLCLGCEWRRSVPLRRFETQNALPLHDLLQSCVERATTKLCRGKPPLYIFDELETVNKALHEAQTADDAEKAERLATGVLETEEHPSRVQQYVADRKRLLADRSRARQVNESAEWRLRLTQRRELLERRKLGFCAREGRTLEILRALQDRHNWAPQELAELEVHLFREPKDPAFAGGMPELPLVLPDHAPFVWRQFKAKVIAHSEGPSHRDSQRKKTVRLRAECVRSSYEACGPALALALCMPVDALPTWNHMKEAPEVEVLCWMPLMFLQEKPSSEFQQIFERAVEADRLIAIRYALAAHLDILVEEMSCDPDDYPATTYDKSFLDRVINRFEVGQSDYLTYHEALATGHSAEAVSKMTRPAWRRAIAHVLRAARIKETEHSLDKLDALGAAFRWTNGPRGYSSHKYDWRTMVDLLVQHGPKGLHLSDLQDIKLVYKRNKAIDGKDKDASTSANKLVETEGGKTAITSSSDRLEADDMKMAATTAKGSSLSASTSNSSPGTAAAATTASALASAAASIGLRRSNRLAPTL